MRTCCEWRGEVWRLYTLCASPSPLVLRSPLRLTGSGGGTICSSTRVSISAFCIRNCVVLIAIRFLVLSVCCSVDCIITHRTIHFNGLCWAVVDACICVGQHLITAVADQTFGFATTSWYAVLFDLGYIMKWVFVCVRNRYSFVCLRVCVCLCVCRSLGERTSSIELDTPQMTDDQLEQLEFLVNEKIREARPMYPTLYADKADPGLAKVRTRGLPDDHEGPVRIVSIDGIENNMCCGTHVSNLSHLQVCVCVLFPLVAAIFLCVWRCERVIACFY